MMYTANIKRQNTNYTKSRRKQKAHGVKEFRQKMTWPTGCVRAQQHAIAVRQGRRLLTDAAISFLSVQLSLLGDRNALLGELIECEQCRCVDFGDFNVEVVIILSAHERERGTRSTRKKSSVRHQKH